MNLSPRSALLLITFGLACGCPGSPKGDQETNQQSETGQPESDSVDDTEAIDLDPFRQMRLTDLTQAVEPTQLAIDPVYGAGLILDPEANTVWGTDALFLHDPRTVCINNDAVRDSSPPGAGGRCPAGTTTTSRGKLLTSAPPLAIGIHNGGGLAGILDANGMLSWVHTDPLATTAQDYMRPQPDFSLGHTFTQIEPVSLAIAAETIGVAQGDQMWVYDHSGVELHRFETMAPIGDIAHTDAGWWTISAAEVALNGEATHSGGISFLETTEGLWAVSPDAITPLETMQEDLAVSNATGPAVQWGEQVLVATHDGITAVTSDSTTLLWSGDVVDMQVNDAGELVVLEAGGSLRIFVDETRYPDDTALHAWISTFIEKPRKASESTPCRGQGETIQNILEQANSNARLLKDLPATIALGITPSHWARATECDERATLESLVEAFELGALFHDAPETCTGNLECYQAALAEALSLFSEPPHWVSGLGAHTELGINWVAALQTIGAPDRFAFFGMSIRPDIAHDSDIRAKNSWPSSLHRLSRTWKTDDVDGILETEDSGWMTIMPGDNVPAFNLGACANLFLNECHPLGRGSGGEIGDKDIESLDLLLHRALTGARGEATHTWNFHLPDIGVYDYTDGCTVTDGIWTGESCEGARLQIWLEDVNGRFVSGGLLQWSTPATVVLP